VTKAVFRVGVMRRSRRCVGAGAFAMVELQAVWVGRSEGSSPLPPSGPGNNGAPPGHAQAAGPPLPLQRRAAPPTHVEDEVVLAVALQQRPRVLCR
jgi:hypothetical protein